MFLTLKETAGRAVRRLDIVAAMKCFTDRKESVDPFNVEANEAGMRSAKTLKGAPIDEGDGTPSMCVDDVSTELGFVCTATDNRGKP